MNDVPPSTQASAGKSKIVYSTCYLFHWDLNKESPFELHDIAKMDESFPRKYITGSLKQKSRMEMFSFSHLPLGDYSLFVKIEQGK